MKKDLILERFRKGGVVFDGGMGSMLIAKGLLPGKPPEEWNVTRPSDVRDVHLGYLEAGADVVGTNTFGSTPARLGGFGITDAAAINTAGVRLALDAVSQFNLRRDRCAPCATPGHHSRRVTGQKLVALSIGPTGMMLPPVGGATQDDLDTEFSAMVQGIEEAVDIVLIETMFDIREALAALTAVREILETVVIVTLTFSRNPRGFYTVMGNEAAESINKIEGAGADVVGANCTLTSSDMVDLARTLRECTTLPVLCQPNAGQPAVREGVPVYDQSPADFAVDAARMFEIGINAVGGCCGTTPDFVREISARVPI